MDADVGLHTLESNKGLNCRMDIIGGFRSPRDAIFEVRGDFYDS